jgi:DinB superfamily
VRKEENWHARASHNKVEVNARLLVSAKGSRHVPSRSLTIEQVLTLLAATPQRIAALTAGLAPAQLHTTPNHDGWSANDVLAHLRACADVWGNCIMAMIAQDTPNLRAVNPRTWIKQTDYLELEFRPSLRSFATQRADLLAVLEPLPHEGWSRAARVSGAGKVLERTVLFYAQWLARHERQHVKQVERIVNTAANSRFFAARTD